VCKNLKKKLRRQRVKVDVLYSYPQNTTFVLGVVYLLVFARAFFLGGRSGTRTRKHFVNVTGESKNFKVLEFPLNQLQTYYG
jgi:hypothetical protein